MEIVLNAVLQIVYLLLPLLACGSIVSLCNRAFRAMTGAFGSRVMFATSLIGTPIHELGHAFGCILFGHKITEMRLISFDPSDGRLGYVKHTYNKHSVYQRIGNFFIGIAPLFSGCAILLLGFTWIPGGVQGVYDLISTEVSDVSTAFQMLKATGTSVLNVFSAFFSPKMLSSPWWWLYVVLGCAVALHVNFDGEDAEDCASGIVAFCLLVFLFNGIAALVGKSFLYRCNRYMMIYNTYMTVFLCLAVLFSVMIVVLSALVFAVRLACGARRKHKHENV